MFLQLHVIYFHILRMRIYRISSIDHLPACGQCSVASQPLDLHTIRTGGFLTKISCLFGSLMQIDYKTSFLASNSPVRCAFPSNSFLINSCFNVLKIYHVAILEHLQRTKSLSPRAEVRYFLASSHPCVTILKSLRQSHQPCFRHHACSQPHTAKWIFMNFILGNVMRNY